MAILADLYCRVSLELQAEEGYSLQEQEERLRAYAKAQGLAIHAVRVDPGFSGASMDRPGLQAVLDDVRAHRIQKVCTYKLDRLSRSQKDTLYLIEDCFIPNGVDYVSATEPLDTGTPLGMAMVGILSVFAQLERQQIKERMAMGRIAYNVIGQPYLVVHDVPQILTTHLAHTAVQRFPGFDERVPRPAPGCRSVELFLCHSLSLPPSAPALWSPALK